MKNQKLSAYQAAGLTMFVLVAMFVLRRMAGAHRSMKRAAKDLAAPAIKTVNDFVDGPPRR